jgi:hypothetical protein
MKAKGEEGRPLQRVIMYFMSVCCGVKGHAFWR